MSRIAPMVAAVIGTAMVVGFGALLLTQHDDSVSRRTTAVSADVAPAAPTDASPSLAPVPASATPAAPSTAPAAKATSPAARPAATAAKPVAPPFPPAVSDLQQGSSYWAVYLAVAADLSDSRIGQSQRQAAAAGYQGQISVGDLGCDKGAREGLTAAGIRLDPGTDYSRTALYFRTQQQARAFVDAYQPGVIGSVSVSTFCLD